MGDAWDWRQSYVAYSDPPEGQDLHPAPEGPGASAPGPPGQEPSAAASGRMQDTARAFSIAAFICGGLALLFLPVILGPLGIAFGFVGNSKGDRMGRWAGFVCIATTVLGIALRIAVSSHVGVPIGE